MFGVYRNRMKGREKKQSRIRIWIQLAFTCLFNGYAVGFFKGEIFNKETKAFCVPVLNCYSCPGALGSCPIGALQASLGKRKGKFPFYVLGILVMFGVLFGRLLCGFVCPFGFFQDLLYKIPGKKLTVNKKIDKPLRLFKYAVLAIVVVLFSLFLKDGGASVPWFCKYICPAGTLEGGIPLVTANGELRELVGGLFTWKLGVLFAIIIASVFIGRFFCRYICPLGAFYSLFNKFSFYRMDVDKGKCTDCKKCEQVCIMATSVIKNCNAAECIRCGKCKAACPTNAIKTHFGRAQNE